MQSLTEIHIYQNGIKEDGMAYLLKSLGYNTNLRSIKINDNYIKNSSPILVEIIPNLTKLEHIDISDSLLGSENALNIFKALSKLPNLKEIHCNYNEIVKKPVQVAILELCLSMPQLKVVELKGNEINPKIWKKFKTELEKKIEKFEAYSEDELENLEIEEDEEDIESKMEKLNI